jgi:hypothetical protein
MSDIKRYEYVSDGFTARFINPDTGHAGPYGLFVLYEDHVKLIEERDLSVRMMIAANTHAREEAAKIVLSKDGLTTQNVILNQQIARQLTENNELRKINYALREEVAKQADRIRRLNKKLKKTKEAAR